MSRRSFRLLMGFLILAAVFVGGLKLRHDRQQELAVLSPPAMAPWAVRTAVVTRSRAVRGFPALALVKGAKEVDVAPRVGGVILEMGPREGQRVAAGDLLAQIDTREVEEELSSLEAEREGAEADAKRKMRDAQRAEKLLGQESVSASRADEIQAEARTAREHVRSLDKKIAAERTRFGYASVTVPFEGVIAERLADPGDLASVGKPLYRLIATDAARLEVRLPAEILESVASGTEVIVSHRDQSLTLHADRVFPSLDERSLGRLEIDVPEFPFGVAPGALVHARIITAAVDDALLLPADAVLQGQDPSRGRVFKLEGADTPRIEIVPVTILLRTSSGVAVDGPLVPGDRVITAHETSLARLSNGETVSVMVNAL